MIRQHLFLPQPSGDSSTDPCVSDDTCVTDVYQPVLKQLIPTRKNNHITGNQHLNSQSDKREYIDIPLPKAIQVHNHEANCARYNEYMLPVKNNLIRNHQCACSQTSSDDKHEMSSNNRYVNDSCGIVITQGECN